MFCKIVLVKQLDGQIIFVGSCEQIHTSPIIVCMFCRIVLVKQLDSQIIFVGSFEQIHTSFLPTVKQSCPGHRPQSVNTDCLPRLRVVASKIEVTVSGQGGT